MSIKKRILFPIIISIFFIYFSITAYAESFKPLVIRFGGNDRYEVAVNVSISSFPKGTTNVILANCSDIKLSDALTATPLAKVLNAPILLTNLDSIPDITNNEIARLKPTNIYIIGGTGSISQNIEDQLSKNYNVIRIGGANRYEVANNVADKLKEILHVSSFDKAYVCNGYKYADALAIAPVASKEDCPILFVSPDVDNDTKNTMDYIKASGITKIDAIGGWASISDDVIKALNANRIDGINRAALSETIASNYYNNSDGIFIVNGYKPADALVLGPYAVKYNYPILFINGDGASIDEKVKDYINVNKADFNSMIVTGGRASVTADAISNIADGYTDLTFLDTNTKLNSDTCNAIKAQGFTGVIRYIGLEQASNYDLTKDEMNDILQSGLGFMVVQHPRGKRYGIVNAQLGTEDGQTAVKIMNQLNPPYKGFNIWVDLEGVKPGTPVEDIVGYCNAWYKAVNDGGYVPGIYIGYDNYMTSWQLYYKLSYQHYWRSMSRVPDVYNRGYQMVQGFYHSINGVAVDINVVYKDNKGDSIIYLTKDGIKKP